MMSAFFFLSILSDSFNIWSKFTILCFLFRVLSGYSKKNIVMMQTFSGVIMRISVWAVCLLFYLQKIHAQELEWIKLINMSSIFDLGADATGHLYLSGMAIQNANFGKEIELNGAFVAKLNSNGNLIWAKNYPHPCSYHVDREGMGYILSTAFGRYSYQGIELRNPHNSLFVARVDDQANPLWVYALESPNGLIKFKSSPKGKKISLSFEIEKELYYQSKQILPTPPRPLGVLIEIDEKGSLTSLQTFEKEQDIFNHPNVNRYFYDSKGFLYVMGKSNHPLLHSPLFNPFDQNFLTKVSPEGQVVWSSTLVDWAEPTSFLLTSWEENRQGFVVGGKFSNLIKINGQTYGKQGFASAFVGQYDAEGNLIWFKSGYSYLNLNTLEVAATQNRIWASGSINDMAFFGSNRVLPQEMKFFLWSIPTESAGDFWVSGNIKRLSPVKDCAIPSGGLQGFRVQSLPSGRFSSTDELGNFSMRVPQSDNRLQQSIPQRYQALFQQFCPFEPFIELKKELNQSPIRNLNFTNIGRETQFLRVNVSSNRRRRCFVNQTQVYFENTGNKAVDDVEVVVIFDKFTLPINSFPYWDVKNGNQLRYYVGRLEAGARGRIQIQDSVICGMEEIRGIFQCTRAEIFPQNPAGFLASELWDGSDLDIYGECINNRITALSIRNVGLGNMSDSTPYRLYVDDKLAIVRKIKLAAYDSQAISVDASTATVRLEAQNTPHNPNRQQIFKSVLPCVDFEFRPQSRETPMLNTEDENATISEECLAILDSYDPNDKLALPAGWGNENCILSSENLKYKIRFQNTGSDTAYKVVIVDTLSQNFDLQTFEIGSSSHRFDWKITGDGQNSFLVCSFENIMLPDSATDPLGSQGFVDFFVGLKPQLPIGTNVSNSADIYFDFNSPITTNSTLHKICELPEANPTLAKKVKSGRVSGHQVSLTAYPNPTRDRVKLQLKQSGWPNEMGFEIVLWDMMGRKINAFSIESTDEPTFENELDMTLLSGGIYIVELRQKGLPLAYAKVLKAH
jgi:uncharacterized repeat protein (TIGR01451 family)